MKCINKACILNMFEWNENKRLETIESRGLDFLRATTIFDGRKFVTLRSKYKDEERFVTIATMDDGKFYSVIWTWRGEVRRIISFRRAWNGEERAYRQVHG